MSIPCAFPQCRSPATVMNTFAYLVARERRWGFLYFCSACATACSHQRYANMWSQDAYAPLVEHAEEMQIAVECWLHAMSRYPETLARADRGQFA